MSPRALIFDVYLTLLDICPPPSDAAAQWDQLCREMLPHPPAVGWLEFTGRCSKIIGREHQAARARGIAHPEIVWPAVVAEVLPELTELAGADREEFVFRQSQLTHTASLNGQAALLLPQLKRQGCLLGIASNAQAYTLRELEQAFAARDLVWTDLFEPGLCFWSYQHGFSKPDAHVFRILTARLQALGMGGEQILMIGDRLDNDVEPARAHGWQTWWLTADPGTQTGGTWHSLARQLGVVGGGGDSDAAAPRPQPWGALTV